MVFTNFVQYSLQTCYYTIMPPPAFLSPGTLLVTLPSKEKSNTTIRRPLLCASSDCSTLEESNASAIQPMIEDSYVPKGLNMTKRQPTFERLFVDFNYLMLTTQKIIIKEMSIVGRTKSGLPFQQSYIVHSPMNLNSGACENVKSMNNDLTDIHGIKWLHGEVNILTIRRLMNVLNNSSTVYVLNEKKATFLKNLFLLSSTICNIEEVLSSDFAKELKPLPQVCAFHVTRPFKMCALNNARVMNIQFDAQRYISKGCTLCMPKK